MRVNFCFVKMGFKQSLAEKGANIGRMAFFAVILLIFSHLWKAIGEHPQLSISNPETMLWYLTITEWIVISTPLVHIQIEREIRNGDVSYLLNRPVSYIGMRIMEEMGNGLARLILLGCFAICFTMLLTGSFPLQPLGLVMAILLGILAAFVSILFQAAIGLTAFWMQDVTPIYWIWQKAGFILGGLLIPISLYPLWLNKIAVMTPFSAMLFRPAEVAITSDVKLAFLTAGLLVFWGVIALILVYWLNRRGFQALKTNGG